MICVFLLNNVKLRKGIIRRIFHKIKLVFFFIFFVQISFVTLGRLEDFFLCCFQFILSGKCQVDQLFGIAAAILNHVIAFTCVMKIYRPMVRERCYRRMVRRTLLPTEGKRSFLPSYFLFFPNFRKSWKKSLNFFIFIQFNLINLMERKFFQKIFNLGKFIYFSISNNLGQN